MWNIFFFSSFHAREERDSVTFVFSWQFFICFYLSCTFASASFDSCHLFNWFHRWRPRRIKKKPNGVTIAFVILAQSRTVIVICFFFFFFSLYFPAGANFRFLLSQSFASSCRLHFLSLWSLLFLSSLQILAKLQFCASLLRKLKFVTRKNCESQNVLASSCISAKELFFSLSASYSLMLDSIWQANC